MQPNLINKAANFLFVASLCIFPGIALAQVTNYFAMNTPATPLQLAHGFDCGPVRVELAYTTVTDPAHVSGRADGDPFRDRFEVRLSNRGLPVGSVFDYQSPQPLQFFFSVLRKLDDGSLLNLTAPQIDAQHTGRPQPRKLSFPRAGGALTDRISYFALATIVPHEELVPGKYLVRIRAFDILNIGRRACRCEPIELPLTIIDSRSTAAAGPIEPLSVAEEVALAMSAKPSALGRLLVGDDED